MNIISWLVDLILPLQEQKLQVPVKYWGRKVSHSPSFLPKNEEKTPTQPKRWNLSFHLYERENLILNSAEFC